MTHYSITKDKYKAAEQFPPRRQYLGTLRGLILGRQPDRLSRPLGTGLYIFDSSLVAALAQLDQSPSITPHSSLSSNLQSSPWLAQEPVRGKDYSNRRKQQQPFHLYPVTHVSCAPTLPEQPPRPK